MKKHLFGFVVFSFIFASFVVAFAYFYAPPIWIDQDPIKTVTEPEPFTNGEGVGRAKVRISQAVIDLKSKEIIIDYIFNREDINTKKVRVLLWFYVQDGKNFKYKSHAEFELKPVFDYSNKAEQISRFQWIGDLKPNENLYVVPQNILAGGGYRFIPEFDNEEATPVILAKEK